MPTYLYECEKCGRFEIVQKITEDPLEECLTCKSPVKRIIGAPGIIFKGSGFYSTDNRSSSKVVNGKEKKDQPKDNKVDSKKESSKEAAPSKKEKVS